MPPAGRKPKPQGQAVTRHALSHDWIEVENIPYEDGPELPATRAGGDPWPARTAEKWETWRAMPHCRLWSAAEWDYALDSLEIAASFHETGEQKYATELRNREKVLGTTLDFRRSLRIRYIEPADPNATGANVTKLSDYRDL